MLFSDLQDFTRISRQLAPEQLVQLMNRYLTMHADAVLDEGGVVDKFEGDAVMAFFGDPLPQEDHALRACRTALRVVEGLDALRPYTDALGIPPLRARIGINSGPAVVGNMGSNNRFDYTCTGDTVNLASRLEGANKRFGTAILAGEATWHAVRDHLRTLPVAPVRVAGYDTPVLAHTLLSGEARPEEQARVTQILRALREDDLDEARRVLDELPADGVRAAWRSWVEGLLDDLASGRRERPWDGLA